VLASRRIAIAAVALLTCAVVPLFAQQPDLRFDVASVKPNGSGGGINFRPHPLDGIVFSNYPLEAIVRIAYGVQPFRVVGLPAWTAEERFDIAAKATRTISEDERRLMMRALLAERFQLKAHFENRERTIYVMTAARADRRLGPGLKPRPDCETSKCSSGGGARGGELKQEAVTLTEVAGMLSTLREELVRDEAGLPGRFDVQLSWKPETSTDSNDDRPAFFTAIQEQLGLKLEPQRRPVEMLIIESIDRPTPD
jgi:uncharacterized protein (TIGR03435 family)